MAYSNCCNCSGNCSSLYGTGYARRINNSYFRNTYAALNTVPSCTRCRNYPFYTGNCPNACGCYSCGCNAGVTWNNSRGCWSGSNCGNCNGWNSRYGNCGCNNCNSCDSCGCSSCSGWNSRSGSYGCNSCDRCNNCNSCGCDNCGCSSCSNCNGCDSCVCNSCSNCNGCDSCGCNGCDDCCDTCSCNCGCNNCNDSAVGLFNANVPVSVTAGMAIPLVASTANSCDFTVSNGAITLKKCGTYLATYTVNVPDGAEVDTTIVMNVNGVAQPTTLLDISAAGSYTAQTLFTACAGATVNLTSSAAFSITDPVGQNVIALTLTKV